MSRADDLAAVDAGLARIGRLTNSRRAARYRSHRSGVDLLPTTMNALAAIHRLGPVRLTALSDHVDLEPSRMSKEVTRLVDAALVTQTPDPSDRRATLLVCTEEGVDAISRYRATVEEILADLLVTFTDDDLGVMASLLHRLADALSVEPRHEGDA